MKKIAVILLTVSLVYLTGCAHTGTTTTADIAPKLQQVVQEGTIIVLAEHPEWKQHFLTAADELSILADSPNINFQTAIDIVNRLPVKELKSRDARLAIQGARLALVFIPYEVNLDTVDKYRPIVTALRDGIRAGIR